MNSAENSADAEYGTGHLGVATMADVMGSPPTPPTNVFRHAATELLFQHVWSRPGLSRKRRRWVSLTSAGYVAAPHAMTAHIATALDSGDITLTELGEFLLTLACYCGWPRANAVDDAINTFLRQRRGSTAPEEPVWPEFTRVPALTRSAEPDEAAASEATPYAAVWGSFEDNVLWARPQLSPGDRRVIAVVGLAAQHAEAAVRRQVAAALAVGDLDVTELREIALHAAYYIGAGAAEVIEEAVTVSEGQ